MIATGSPSFRPPWPAWRIRPTGGSGGDEDGGRTERPGETGKRPGGTARPFPPAAAPAGPTGVLDLRVGYCAGVAVDTVAERANRIDERERAGDPVAAKGNLRSSLVPVVLVDGAPAATGWGRIALPLAPGRHLVEVQSQHSRAWRAVDIAAGKTTRIDYVGMLGDQHRAYGAGALPRRLAAYTGWALGPRGRLDYYQYLPSHARSRLSAAVLLLCAIAGAVAAMTAVALGAPIPAALGAEAAVVGLALAIWGARVLWTWIRFNRGEPEASVKTPEAIFRIQGAALVPEVLDPKGPLPAIGHGAAAILLDAGFLKTDLDSDELALQLPKGRNRIDADGRKTLDAVGEIAPLRHRYAVPPPAIELDGARLAATWTRMWLEVPPGTHRLAVRTPAAPLPVAGAAESDRREATVNLRQGQVAHVDLTVAVHAAPDPDRAVLRSWDCLIQHLGPAADGDGATAPRVDVRGAVHRALTGRWWETRDDR